MMDFKMDRRRFLRNSVYSSLLFGAGGLPYVSSNAYAGFTDLQNRLLVNLNLDGGPDIRHLIVPAMPTTLNATTRATVQYKYWQHRHRTQAVANSEQAWIDRWNNEYHHISINDGSINQGRTFGIWKGAGWLIKMYEAGNVAFIANTAIGRNRAHDRSQTQLKQGDVFAMETDTQRSGWGGRLARFTNDNSVSLTGNPSPFCFGPADTPVYDPHIIDNRSFISITDSRNVGLFNFDITANQTYRLNNKLARSQKSYYKALQNENANSQLSQAYQKALDHEDKISFFGEQLNSLLDFDVPPEIRALYDRVDGINLGDDNSPRRILRRSSFGRQIRNLYDTIAVNNVLRMRVANLSYGGWDSHSDQGDVSGNGDVYNPNIDRGIENNFRDIFGGPVDANSTDLHGGFSALWENLDNVNKDKMLITVAGEFGRQIRQNGNDVAGTDHGDGNIVMLIGNAVSGGVYGDLFPESEVEGYDAPERSTPDIESLTEMDHVFGKVCDWVSSSSINTIVSSTRVFPRLLETPGTEAYPDLEAGVSLDNLIV